MVVTIKMKQVDCVSFSETQNIIVNEKVSPIEMEEIVKKSISENNDILDKDELKKVLTSKGNTFNEYYDIEDGEYVFSLLQYYNEPVVMITQKEKSYSNEDFGIDCAGFYHSEYQTIGVKVIEQNSKNYDFSLLEREIKKLEMEIQKGDNNV